MATLDPRTPQAAPGPEDGDAGARGVQLPIRALQDLVALACILVGVAGLVILAWQWDRGAGIGVVCLLLIGLGVVLGRAPDEPRPPRAGSTDWTAR